MQIGRWVSGPFRSWPVMLLTAAALAGCASIYDPLPPTDTHLTDAQRQLRRQSDPGLRDSATLGQIALGDAIVDTEYRRSDLFGARRRAIVGGGRLGTGVLLGTAATTASAVFRGPPDLIAGLALGTNTTQTTRALYFQRGYDATYLSALRGLGCISRASRSSLDADIRAQREVASLARARQVIERLQDIDPKAAANALAKSDTAARTAGNLEGATESLARQVPVATTQIVDEASQQLADQMPDAAAFSAAVERIGSFTRPAAATSRTATEVARTGPTATAGHSPEEDQQFHNAIQEIDEIAAAIETARKDFESKSGEALKTCGYTPVATLAPLTLTGVDKNAVTLKKGESTSFSVEGGSGDYFTSIVGTRPAGVDVAVLGSTVEIRVDAKQGKSGAFQLRIRDLGKGVQPITVAVTIQ